MLPSRSNVDGLKQVGFEDAIGVNAFEEEMKRAMSAAALFMFRWIFLCLSICSQGVQRLEMKIWKNTFSLLRTSVVLTFDVRRTVLTMLCTIQLSKYLWDILDLGSCLTKLSK